MPRFAANLTMMFTEFDFMDRFRAASDAGFRGVEFHFPYEYPANRIALELQRNHLQLVLFNLPAGDWAAGERGIACLPARVEEFRAGVSQAISYADPLGCQSVNCLAGICPSDLDAAVARHTLRDNLRYAADCFAGAGLELLVEPINSKVDIPGFFLDTATAAAKLIEEVDRPNIRLQYDLYHMQIMEGKLSENLPEHMDLIGHIQFADVPGRGQPGTGEMDFDKLFKQIDQLGYGGWVSAEYIPRPDTATSLNWFAPATRDNLL